MTTEEHLLSALNPQQRIAVTAEPQHQLILAGAGSGKTRVLVHRIAWLIHHYHFAPQAMLAVTFTNKAAAEMRSRIENLLQSPVNHLWVGTFHGLAHRLLRVHWREADLSESFQIMDADDQYRLVRRIQREMNLDETRWPPKQMQWFINKEKEAGRRAHDSVAEDDYFSQVSRELYARYEEICRSNHLVDFSELLLRSLELLQKNSEIADHYRKRFQCILIDEFQDTNSLQYRWLKQFNSGDNYFVAVGDDDQSIYGWRGACNNMPQFQAEFKASPILLEQNYRSTKIILDAANAVISLNNHRSEKNLWTEGDEGQPISLYPAFNERDEAAYIASTVQQWLDTGRRAKEVAVLYRSNAQSRVLEEQFLEKQIPYRIYGGLRFYERAEIKDVIAYLRLLVNRNDDAAFERVINTPTRGIGNTTLNVIRNTARELEVSLWQASEQLLSENKLSARAASALQNFIHLINEVAAQLDHLSPAKLIELVLDKSGLLLHFQKESSEKAISRVENLREFVNAAAQFHPEDYATRAINEFLAHVALESGEEQSSEHSDCINLMTLHAAKGLEFPLVFISGMEEGLFPHKMSASDAQKLEEERRLCYVGITRAMEKLVLTYSESRRVYGMQQYNSASRFIEEIPQKLIRSERPRAKVSRPVSTHYYTDDVAESIGFNIGQHVKHPKFGAGVITNFEGQGDNMRIQVKFKQHGSKWLVASFARLEAA